MQRYLVVVRPDTVYMEIPHQQNQHKNVKANYLINKVKNVLPQTSLKYLYLSLIHSHINYGLVIWGASCLINKVFKMQKRSIRTINNKPVNVHTEPLFKMSKILTIEDQYKFNVLVLMHTLKNNKLPSSFDTIRYFTAEERVPTRQQQLAHYRRYRTTFTSLVPLHRFPKLWNEQTPMSHDITSLNIFKKETRGKLFGSC